MSVSSVSRTLNGGIYTSAELHARIMRAVKRLGFEPDSAAQALCSRASNTIGCMVADFSNPHYTGMVSAAEEEFQRAGFLLMLAATKHEWQVSHQSEARALTGDGDNKAQSRRGEHV
ncbi:LacI family DNA-binding transcriptional regulator [Bradyrhizobium sp. ISRA435]|nr:LacI family DNA-binding transcriptional regulator [Bradyrhizobium sp. ISRA435]